MVVVVFIVGFVVGTVFGFRLLRQSAVEKEQDYLSLLDHFKRNRAEPGYGFESMTERQKKLYLRL